MNWLSRCAIRLLLACVLSAAPQVFAAQASVSLEDVAAKATALKASEARQHAAREAVFQQAYSRQQQLLNEVQAQRAQADRNGAALSAKFDANEQRIVEMRRLLQEHQGNLGELFGVTRQVAGDVGSELRQSLTATQFHPADAAEDREVFLRRLATAKALPSIDELGRLWFEVQREMSAGAEVVRYQAPVVQGEGAAAPVEVLRVGGFTASAGDRFLGYLPGAQSFTVLPRQPPQALRDTASALARAPGGSYVPAVVDPSRGALLGLYVERPSWLERIDQGGLVGYATLAIGVLGAAGWFGQFLYLLWVRSAVARQLRNVTTPNAGNPLGRLLLALSGDNARTPADIAELRISAAVLREVPRLERLQGFLRLAVAAGPLLGLIGTVIGMILTFQSITAAGASDPKLVAHGIGQAMIATVLGLGIAIPLLFANSLLGALSRGIVQILDEQGEALLASRLAQTAPPTK